MFESLTSLIATSDGEELYARLEHEVRAFVKAHPEFDFDSYEDILEENDILSDWQSMVDADVSGLDDKSIMALLVGALEQRHNAEDGFEAIDNEGCIRRWLERLRDIDGETAPCPAEDECWAPVATNGEIAEAIRDLYKITNKLEELFEGRHFTPDGHLVGSMGEVYAAERYGLELFVASHKAHDGKTSDGKLVQIKATQRSSIGISEEPDYLIVLHIEKNGEFHEEYNGPGEQVWELFDGKKRPTNGQYQVSLSKLRELDAQVLPEARIKVVVQDEEPGL